MFTVSQLTVFVFLIMQRSATSSGKYGRRVGGASVASSSSVAHRRGPERRRTATAIVMCIFNFSGMINCDCF